MVIVSKYSNKGRLMDGGMGFYFWEKVGKKFLGEGVYSDGA